MKKRAIVTGGTGFVGSELCKKLIDLNWEVIIISRKSSNYLNILEIKEEVIIYEYEGIISELIEFFKQIKADVVFHLASLFIAEHKLDQIDALIKSNVQFGLHILEAMKESKTKLIINTGTSWQHYHSNNYNPVCLYAATKEAFESLMQYYIQAENIRAITLKLFDTYGENDKRSKLINSLNKFADEQKELKMSSGNQIIDLVHVDDVTNAFIKSYEYLFDNKEIKHNEFAVSSGKEISLKELINIFEKITGKKLNITWGGRENRKREVMYLWRDFEVVPNWKPYISLKEGLLRYKD